MNNVFGHSSIRPVPSGVTTAAAYIAREIGLVDITNQMVRWDDRQCRLSPGERILALVVGILFDRTALWRLHEVLVDQDLAVLFGPGVAAIDFNDDALGRALDKLSRANPEHVFATLTTKALAQEGRSWSDLSVLHADTTSVSVWGAYETPARNALAIRHGYSKQHRPDLKQFGIGLLATAEGIPFRATVHDGNLADKRWNHQILDRLKQELSPAELDRLLYVADSALVTRPNLQKITGLGLRFVSRLPEVFGVCALLQQAAWANDQWTDVGPLSPRKQAAQYRVQELPCELDGQAYRAIVIHSTSLDARKQKALVRQQTQQQADLQDALDQLGKQAFNCEADAMRAATELAKTAEDGFWRVLWRVADEQQAVKRTGPGRPKRDESRQYVTRWRVHGELQLREERYTQVQRQAGTFVLISNDPRRTAVQLLEAYKSQNNSVEIPFRVLKALPISPVYLKSPERVRAFAWVVLMAYLVYAIMQHRVRSALQAEADTLITPGGRPSSAPTAKSVLDMLGTIQTVIVQLPTGQVQRHPHSHNPNVPKLLTLLGVPLEAYTIVPRDDP